MLSFLRAATPPRTNTASQDLLTFDDGAAVVRFNGPDQEYAMTHTVPPKGSLPDEPSVMEPPFHYHMCQDEKFRARSGAGKFWVGLDSAPTVVLSATGPETVVTVPMGRYHRFENASTTEPFVVDVNLDPENYEQEQRFFRNFLGYVDDCKKAKMAPSLFQMMLFLHAADIPLALPVPHPALETNVGVWASRAFMIAVAAAGRAMGYRDSYPEYYLGPKGR